MDLATPSTSFKENNNSLNSTTAASLTSTPRQRPRRVKMPSDISGMFCPHENISTPPSVPSLINISLRRSTMSMMMMPMAPSLSSSERSVPPETRQDEASKSAPCSTEEQDVLASTGRKLRRMKRQLLLDSVVKSTSDQMASFQEQQHTLSTGSTLSERGGNGSSNMYS